MASINYPALQAIASQTIEAFGRSAILRSDDGDVPVTAAILDYERRGRDGYLIQFADRRALIAVRPGVPLPDPERHTLVVDGQAFRIINAGQLSPGGTALYFECQVRP